MIKEKESDSYVIELSKKCKNYLEIKYYLYSVKNQKMEQIGFHFR